MYVIQLSPMSLSSWKCIRTITCRRHVTVKFKIKIYKVISWLHNVIRRRRTTTTVVTSVKTIKRQYTDITIFDTTFPLQASFKYIRAKALSFEPPLYLSDLQRSKHFVSKYCFLVMNKHDTLFLLHFVASPSSTCSWFIFSPSSGG
jgi:hypothetical protein